MSDQVVAPVLGKKSFNCPHCGAFAHQTWLYTMADGYSHESSPWVPAEAADLVRELAAGKHRELAHMRPFYENVATGLVFIQPDEAGKILKGRLYNLDVSRCFSCRKLAVWVGDKLVFPVRKYTIRPHDDMPSDVATDFAEAAEIVEASPRGAAALVRLAIQKLMPHLGEKGKDLNGDIGNLVKKGLDAKIQQALDLVRVVGNNAVHPGQINLKDNKDTALRLFTLVNLIVESQISTPKHVAAMYEDLVPKTAKKAIEKRDKGNA